MSRYFIGDGQNVTFRYESGTYGTPSGANNWLGIVTDHVIDENLNVQELRYAGTNSRAVQQFLDGQQDFNGTLTYYPQSFRMLKFVLGSCVDGGSPSPFQHNYGPNTNAASCPEVPNMPLAPFTMVDEQSTGIAGSNFNRTINGCVVTSWNLSVAQGEPVSCSLSYVGQSLAYANGAIANVSGTDLTRPYQYSDVRLRIPSGTAVNEVKNVSLAITNNLQADHYVDGNKVIGQPAPGNLDVELTVTLNATAEHTKALYDQYFLGGSPVNVVLGLQQTAAVEETIFTLSGCKLLDMNAPSPSTGMHEQTLTFRTGSLSVIEHNDAQFHNFGSYAGF